MRICSVVILFVLTVVKSQEINLDLSLDLSESLAEEHEAITNSVVDIISSFYLQTTSVLNILTEHKSGAGFHNPFSDILSKTLQLLGSRFAVMIEESEKLKNNDRKAAYNIIFVDSYESFKIIFAKLNTEDFDLQGYFLIVLTRNDGQQRHEMKMMFDAFWSKYIVNVNIIHVVTARAKESKMFTYFPYSEAYCEKVFPVLLNVYRVGSGFAKSVEHFPNKLKNFYGCQLSLVTFEVPPFIMLTTDENNSTSEVDGFEGILMKILADRMNFTLKTTVGNKTGWGLMEDDGTGNGTLQLVMENKFNMTIGFFSLSPIKSRYLSFSSAYYTSNLVWMIPSAKPWTPFQRFHKPFHREIWLMITVTIFISIVVICVLKCQKREIRQFVIGRDVRNPILNLTNVFLGGAMTVLPGRNFARFLLMMCLIYTLVMRNVYTGILFRFLQLDVSNEKIKDIDEMLVKDFKFLTIEALRDHVDNLTQVSKRSTVLRYRVFLRDRELLLNYENKVAMLASEEHVAYWNQLSFPKIVYNTCKEKHSTINLVLFLNKLSCLTSEINRHFAKFNANGLIDVLRRFHVKMEYLKKKAIDEKPKKLTFSHLSGGFHLYTYGIVASMICFLMELIVHYIKVILERR